jgi:hypothetical protein
MECIPCIQRAQASVSRDLEAAKKKARAWGKATGHTELIIVLKDGAYGYRTTDTDITGYTEVDRILIL